MVASLVLQDGQIISGAAFGAEIDVDGEVVFQTGMVTFEFLCRLSDYNYYFIL